jgi:hypothetical protein
MNRNEGDTPEQNREPQGFAEHTRKNPSENAHEQGWGLNEEERTRLPKGKQPTDGGTDYDYGAQDFGDTPVDTSAAKPAAGTLQDLERENRKSGSR